MEELCGNIMEVDCLFRFNKIYNQLRNEVIKQYRCRSTKLTIFQGLASRRISTGHRRIVEDIPSAKTRRLFSFRTEAIPRTLF